MTNKNMNKKENALNVIDLFCGAGGMSEGFQQAGYNVVLGIDHIERFVDTFKKNHKKAKGIVGDIRKLSVDQIKKEIKNKKVDVIVGGPPCQGFSMAGRRDPKDPRNSLFMEYVRIVNGLNPKIFVMENVRGMLSMKTAKGERVLDLIEEEFKKIGYKIKYQVLTASDYGVPQKRQRLIIIGTNTKRAITHPQPSHSEKPYITLDGKKILPWKGVSSVILDKQEVDKSFFHSQRMIEGFRRRKEKHLSKGNGFGAQFLKMDKPSYTISARYWKDGSDALVKYSDDEIRMLTPLEAARIQSFPDDYEFVGSKKEVYTQIGNAVPPLLGKAIGEHIKKFL
jgi:DNA (cytosine-5)-methyltransferase 1